jgi:hypothetical protein
MSISTHPHAPVKPAGTTKVVALANLQATLRRE